MDANIDNKKAIETIEIIRGWMGAETPQFEALTQAIAALEFLERYDQFWEDVKAAGMKGKETEIHHSGRVFRIREVAQ